MKQLKAFFHRIAEGCALAVRRVSIFKRLIVTFSILVIIPTLFITIFSFKKYVAEIENDTELFLSLLVENIAVQMNNRIEEIEENAIDFYRDNVVISMLNENRNLCSADLKVDGAEDIILENTQRVGQKLYELADFNRHIQNVQFITPQHQYSMYSTSGYQRGFFVRDLEEFCKSEYYTQTVNAGGYPVWFDTTRDANIFYKYESSIYGLSDCVMMAVAVYSPSSHELLGVLTYSISVNLFSQSMTNYSFYGSGNTFLIGKQDTLLGFSPSLQAPNFSDQRGVVEQMRISESGTINSKTSTGNVFVCYRKLPKVDFYIAHIVDKDALLEPAYRIRNLSLLVVAFLIIALVLISYLTTISVTHPLNQLMLAMKNFVNNKFDARYTVTGMDEITVLGEHFNEMANNTKALVDQVYVAGLKQKTLELSKANAELNALQMQINPHFLYNTMDIIRWEALYEAGGESKVSHMIDDFCLLMRRSIKVGADIVSVSTELEHAQIYIDVVNFRHTQKIELTYEFAFHTQNYYIPKLTLQPLMENAVLHGFDTERSEKHIIKIVGIEQDNMLVITVSDNGTGMSDEELERLRASFSGMELLQNSIGLRNVNQRLKLLFGEDYGVEVTSKLGVGTTVCIQLPICTG